MAIFSPGLTVRQPSSHFPTLFHLIAGAALVAILTTTAASQSLIRGNVTDRSSGEPLPYAHILVEGEHYGTAANSQGRFVLQARRMPITLVVRYMGYQPVRVNVSRMGRHELAIPLEPSVFNLDAIEVPANFADVLIQHAFERGLDQRNNQYVGRAFYRQLTRSDSVYTELLEIFFSAALSNDGISRWEIDHGRYAVRPDTLENNYVHTRDFTWFTRNLSLFQTQRPFFAQFLFPLRNGAPRHFDFQLAGRLEEEGRLIAQISFSPKQHVRMPAFSGNLFIDEVSHDVLRFEARIQHPRYQPLRSMSGRSFLKDIEIRYEASFRPIDDTTTVLEYIKVDALYDQIRRREFVRKIHTESILAFYDYRFDMNPRRIRSVRNDLSDYRLIDRARYDPEFWARNPILEETPIEEEVRRSFEQSGSFGKVFADGRP